MQELGTNCWIAQLEHDLSFSPVSPFDGQTLEGPRGLNWGCTVQCRHLLQLELAALFHDWRVQIDIGVPNIKFLLAKLRSMHLHSSIRAADALL